MLCLLAADDDAIIVLNSSQPRKDDYCEAIRINRINGINDDNVINAIRGTGPNLSQM